MSDYVKTTAFTAKDSLPTGNAAKIIKGSEFDTEFDALATAVATKLDKTGGTVSGTVALNGASNTAVSMTVSGVFALSGDQVQVTEGGTGAATAADARTNLGLGTMATQAASAVAITGGTMSGVPANFTSGSISGITDLAIADGGTGSSTAAGARTNLGLGSFATVDTTIDSNGDSGAQASDATYTLGNGIYVVTLRCTAPSTGYETYGVYIEHYDGSSWIRDDTLRTNPATATTKEYFIGTVISDGANVRFVGSQSAIASTFTIIWNKFL